MLSTSRTWSQTCWFLNTTNWALWEAAGKLPCNRIFPGSITARTWEGCCQKRTAAKGLHLPTHACSLPLPSPGVWDRITPWTFLPLAISGLTGTALGHAGGVSDSSHLPLRDKTSIRTAHSLYSTEGIVFVSYILLKPYQKTGVRTLNHLKMYQFSCHFHTTPQEARLLSVTAVICCPPSGICHLTTTCHYHTQSLQVWHRSSPQLPPSFFILLTSFTHHLLILKIKFYWISTITWWHPMVAWADDQFVVTYVHLTDCFQLW